MINWWNGLELTQQIFALIAIPSTVILVLQTVLQLIGIGSDNTPDDIDTDGDGIPDTDASDSLSADDGLSLFTVRGILSMLCITGWLGVALLETSLPDWAAILISVAAGVATLVGIAFLMKAIYGLQSSGNIDISNAIGKVAQIYIPVPAGGRGSGKVTITLQDKFCEYAAITTADRELKTGNYVRVVAVSESGVLVVEPLASDAENKK
ncbi:MAG: hypothetical protein ACI3XO_02200 [Eubacteriales bacterium]